MLNLKSLLLFGLIFSLTGAAVFAGPVREFYKTTDPIKSMAPTKRGGVFLLMRTGVVLEVNSEGKSRLFPLPTIGSNPPKFSDFTILGSDMIFFKGMEPRLYFYNPKTDKDYRVVPLKNFPPKTQIVFLAGVGNELRIVDSHGTANSVSLDGEVKPLPQGTFVIPMIKAADIRLLPPQENSKAPKWVVMQDGREVYSCPVLDETGFRKTLLPIGMSEKGTVLLLEERQKTDEQCFSRVIGVKDGKIDVSADIESQGMIATARPHMVLSDGSILLMRNAPDRNTIFLLRLMLP